MADSDDAPKTERSYSVCKELQIDLAAGAIQELRDEFGKDAKIDVIVRVGRVVKKTPKEALQALGQKKDLNGKFEVITDSAIKTYEVKTEQKREVSIE